MLTHKAQLECIVNEKLANEEIKIRRGTFYTDQDCPLVVAKEMLFQFQKFIGLMEDSAKKQQEESKIEPIPQDESQQA